MRRLVLCALSLASLVSGRAVPAMDAPPSAPSQRKSNLPAVLAAGVGIGGVVVGSVPGARRAVRKLLGQEALDLGEEPPAATSSSAASSTQQTEPTAPPVKRPSEPEKFALTPDKLATISELNPRLEELGAALESVPVFTAAVGNGTSPLTVPADDGRKLAYFFTEHADAEAFLAAVRDNAGLELEAKVIGVSLSDIIKAYSSAEAKAAKETFVLIPTMAEVAAARHLISRAGLAEKDADKLGPGNGLVPIFWSDALAVQSAGGKQRKVLFFRLGDLQQMWRGLAEARKESGEIDDLPEGPTVQVSSLQTMAGLLTAANKSDEVTFLPSSTALRRASGAEPAYGDPEAEGRSGGAGGGSQGLAAMGASGDVESEAEESFGESIADGEEEDATGGAI